MVTTNRPTRALAVQNVGQTVRVVGAVAGIAAPVVFVTAVLLGGAGAAGFSQSSSFISELGETGAATAPFVNAAFVAVGVLLVVFAAGIAAAARDLWRAGALLVVPGAAFVVMAASPCSHGCPIAVVNVAATTSDAVHNGAAIAGLVAIAMAALTLGEVAPDGFGARGYASFSGAAGAAVGMLSALFGLAVLSGSRPVIGISERVLVLAALVWVEMTAVALLRYPFDPERERGIGRTERRG